MKLTIHNLSKVFGEKIAVNQINTELTPGVYGILGANGCGKTTLMRMLAGILRPSSGEILFNGTNIQVLDERYRDILGYHPQHIGYYQNISAEKLLLYIAALKGLEKTQAKKKVEELLGLVNLLEHRNVKVGKFSGGMKQRVGIAQALLNDPKVLIVDEPTAGLDPKERIRFRNLLSQIAYDRIVLLSTHIVSDIEYIAKEVLILKNGELIQKSTPQMLLAGLRGKVWNVQSEESKVLHFQEHYKVGNMVKNMDGVSLRIISDEKPSANATKEVPNLEDLYLYYFDEEVTRYGVS
ncbi:ABC transporter ATP-binding protein [Bacillus sp. FJAT-49736]|uniref:ABC transporter ATP-binding protein n=1 Tax=Bacillus sp. FJAT-49736 TaxID=2833582 RepID=UPI001BC95B3B|nr:ABC transporter ATP-binding protein [Bacillus sp. FJAT-49736]MBS4175224.1 ABC transporter ATP-binding protein [Bacillus sp. FJAT-49736]